MANRPPLEFYQHLDSVHGMQAGEIKFIADKTGNHWRKIFNVYAKFIAELWPEKLNDYARWQDLRDNFLLRENSHTSLIFSNLLLDKISSKPQNTLHLICGRQYGIQLAKQAGITLTWLLREDDVGNGEFAWSQQHNVMICPYFDYRQLSNVKIKRLVELIKYQLTSE
ncbi:hypothetical protein C2869_17510 [Saccharobesus litoralis]|uniref:Uncharacterized protein n=1 Tax=Saccharobesus litoralis TaxID=2172099 RepID=A0A2S0VY69_9ALTE|nr:hypothetical protein C2869_17510 [Saccharobesus litoralis]